MNIAEFKKKGTILIQTHPIEKYLDVWIVLATRNESPCGVCGAGDHSSLREILFYMTTRPETPSEFVQTEDCLEDAIPTIDRG